MQSSCLCRVGWGVRGSKQLVWTGLSFRERTQSSIVEPSVVPVGFRVGWQKGGLPRKNTCSKQEAGHCE